MRHRIKEQSLGEILVNIATMRKLTQLNVTQRHPEDEYLRGRADALRELVTEYESFMQKIETDGE